MNHDFQEGHKQLANERFEQAIQSFSKVIESDPEFENVLQLRGRAYFKTKSYNLAIQDFTRAISLQPEDAEIFSERALAYFLGGFHDEACKDFDRTVALEPENDFRFACRAFFKSKTGDLQGASKDYQTALSLDPDNIVTQNNYEVLQEQISYRKQKKSPPHTQTNGSQQSAHQYQTIGLSPSLEPVNAKQSKPTKLTFRHYWQTLRHAFGTKTGFEDFKHFLRSLSKRNE